MYLSYLSCIKKFGLPPSPSSQVKRNVNDEECLPRYRFQSDDHLFFEVQNDIHIKKQNKT